MFVLSFLYKVTFSDRTAGGEHDMEHAKYIFQISPYDTEKLLPQVSKALEKRAELISREQYPGMWRLTDRANAMARGRTRSRLRTRIMSTLCLALGIFLFIPGLMKPQELLVPLLAGAAAIGAGIGGLWRSRKQKKNPFDRSAKILLAGKDSIAAQQAVMVSFSEDGMTIPTEDGDTEFVPYSSFTCAIEVADILLFVYDERVTVLQKNDLITGDSSGLCTLLSEKVTKFTPADA